MGKNLVAIGIAAMALGAVLSDGDRFCRAFLYWEARKTPTAALHVLTSGWLLVEDIASLA